MCPTEGQHKVGRMSGIGLDQPPETVQAFLAGSERLPGAADVKDERHA